MCVSVCVGGGGMYLGMHTCICVCGYACMCACMSMFIWLSTQILFEPLRLL